MSDKNDEIVRLQGIIKRLEGELHDCTTSVLNMAEAVTGVNSADTVIVAVENMAETIYHKYSYRVKGYDFESLILDEVN